MNKSNTLYWKTATDPAERIEVRLVLNSYIDNDNLYVGLESRSKENPECWESYTDIRQPQFPSPVPCLCGQPGLQQTRT